MGTHPIFESDFDCLTGFRQVFDIPARAEVRRVCVNFALRTKPSDPIPAWKDHVKMRGECEQSDEFDTGFRCLCAAGWGGWICGDDIDECTANDGLCQNNGNQQRL